MFDMKLPKNLDEQFFKDATNSFSMMRLVVYKGMQMARLVVLAGLVILPFELFVFDTKTITGMTLVGIGTAMFGIGEGAKAFQAKSENTGGK